jgi:hypothetical protein
MDDSIRKRLVAGAKVVVTQQIAHRMRERAYADKVIGTVVGFEQKPTGSWYAHSKGEKLWLDRLKIRQENGELTTLVLDEYSAVEVVDGPAVAAGPVEGAAKE